MYQVISLKADGVTIEDIRGYREADQRFERLKMDANVRCVEIRDDEGYVIRDFNRK